MLVLVVHIARTPDVTDVGKQHHHGKSDTFFLLKQAGENILHVWVRRSPLFNTVQSPKCANFCTVKPWYNYGTASWSLLSKQRSDKQKESVRKQMIMGRFLLLFVVVEKLKSPV